MESDAPDGIRARLTDWDLSLVDERPLGTAATTDRVLAIVRAWLAAAVESRH